ncbi:hypothetical protein PAPYR_5253 [Paratrimastix pyriformis]|uniref:Protein kinase domain-containing protein n=1 Tax=Paratrimastix pyriformis TaxID=342808 RepID=A0ABQ8UKK7_9EUKA|nr:hypothetical protein PAPYR_5253 [Paratrimastix pyriformis]
MGSRRNNLVVAHAIQFDTEDEADGALRRSQWAIHLRPPHSVLPLKDAFLEDTLHEVRDFLPAGNLKNLFSLAPFPIGRCVELARTLAEALLFLDVRSMVTPNLFKPENLLLLGDQSDFDLVVSDWSSARQPTGPSDFVAPDWPPAAPMDEKERLRFDSGCAMYSVGLLLACIFGGISPDDLRTVVGGNPYELMRNPDSAAKMRSLLQERLEKTADVPPLLRRYIPDLLAPLQKRLPLSSLVRLCDRDWGSSPTDRMPVAFVFEASSLVSALNRAGLSSHPDPLDATLLCRAASRFMQLDSDQREQMARLGAPAALARLASAEWAVADPGLHAVATAGGTHDCLMLPVYRPVAQALCAAIGSVTCNDPAVQADLLTMQLPKRLSQMLARPALASDPTCVQQVRLDGRVVLVVLVVVLVVVVLVVLVVVLVVLIVIAIGNMSCNCKANQLAFGEESCPELCTLGNLTCYCKVRLWEGSWALCELVRTRSGPPMDSATPLVGLLRAGPPPTEAALAQIGVANGNLCCFDHTHQLAFGAAGAADVRTAATGWGGFSEMAGFLGGIEAGLGTKAMGWCW